MSDYNFLMESRLSPQQLRVLGHLSRVAAEQGLNLYLVGGAVRDLTYGQQIICDLDFAVEGNPQKILRRLSSGRRARIDARGVATAGGEPAPVEVDDLRLDARLNAAEVGFTNGIRAEVAMTRDEVYSKPARRPEVLLATIFEDLKRRDFSANAMAISLHPNSRGLLLDPTNGAAEIEKRELRALHNRSFLEDPSRVYRLLRLGLRLGFKPEERTKTLLESALENRVWSRLDPQQQGRELRAILQEENPQRVMKHLADRGLVAGLDRKISSAKIPFERFAKIRSVIRAVPRSDGFLLNFHALVEKLSGSQKSRLAKKIIINKRAIKLALSFEHAARKLARTLVSSKAGRPSQVYTLLSREPRPLLLFLLVHYRQAKIQNRVKSFLLKHPLVRAKLPRAELQAIGMKPGPKFEKVLEQIFLDQLDGKIKTHPQLMKELRRISGIKEPPKPAQPAPRLAKKKR